MIRLSDPNEKILDEMSKAKWEQCICGKWFIANGRQIYCRPQCRNNFNSKLARLRAEKDKSNYHYVSIKGVMYESNRTESRY